VWEYYGQKRPPFAEEPGPGQESVWDYPRPPKLVADRRRIEVRLGATIIADSEKGFRVLETASPPTFYLPPHDVRAEILEVCSGASVCEWKGLAQYWALKRGARPGKPVGWSYPKPKLPFESIANYFSFYPARVECYVEGERVHPQSGQFYGGWVTAEIVGPFKGAAGTHHW
jgi:uncharacterized protein (DUF427 family)